MTKRQKILSWIVFGIYFAWLAWAILFKFSYPGHPLPHGRSVEWIPFAARDIEFRQTAREMTENALIFVPLGVYIAALFPKGSALAHIGAGCAVSVLFEALQFVFALGATDITDVLMNTAGCAFGVLLWAILHRIFGKHAITVTNVLGLAAEVFFGFMAAVVLIYNH